MHHGTSNVSKCGSSHSCTFLSPTPDTITVEVTFGKFQIIFRLIASCIIFHSSLRLNELYEVDTSAQIAIARVFLFLFLTPPESGEEVCSSLLPL